MRSSGKDEVRVGTAGWDYEDWKGIVYPLSKPMGFDPLEYLSRYFDCCEINSTFYRIPDRRVCASWMRRVERNGRFSFTLKLYRGFTHERGPLAGRDAGLFREAVAPILEAGRLGCVLMQFPWSFKNAAKNRDYLRGLFQEFSALPLVLEVRHTSWNVPPFYDFLSEHGVGFCNIDQPLFSGSLEPSARSTARVGYFRLHGQNYDDWFREGAGRDARYNYLYSEEELASWIARVEAVREQVSSIYVIMNNHFKGQAACNALQVKARLSGSQVPVPPSLLAAFPQLEKVRRPYTGQGDLW
ncbi:MAG: DUF72 domain-containing protein [Candidatus Aureabacteria bacterium]|nr:DUF72 domain-containing protein [Candidatus Auribacterota bacterium]